MKYVYPPNAAISVKLGPPATKGSETPEPTVPTITLHDGVEIPQLGLGVSQVPPAETQSAVEHALDIGYRHIDTVAPHRNETAVGAALANANLPRQEVFVTSKLWSAQQGYDSTLRAFEVILSRLGFECIDLCLIHAQVAGESCFVDTWRALERILEEGRARTVGVWGFRIEDLEQLEAETDTRPTVHQVDLHPRLQQVELRKWHAEYRIATEAWSPLAQRDLLADKTIGEVASRHGKTPAQTILRWHMQLGNIAIPQSATAEQNRENIEIFDFELSDEEMAVFTGGQRLEL
ncbi:MAG TPA: aldo/keto reductase [Solirubrobacterales bacterium]|nr:aldo/keto reductase [Solirubrobacterales bacterium]